MATYWRIGGTMISAITYGVIASSGSSASGSQATPVPLFINGVPWSFTRRDREQAPSIGIVSATSSDGGVTYTETNVTYHTSFAISTDLFGNGIICGARGSFVNHKSLLTPASDWMFTNVSNLPGGRVAWRCKSTKL